MADATLSQVADTPFGRQQRHGRLHAGLSGNGKIPVEQMSPEQRAALKKLQDYEIAVASKSFKLQEEIIVPVEERIQQEIFSRKVQ